MNNLFFRRRFKYTYKHVTLSLIFINFVLLFVTMFMPQVEAYLALCPGIMLHYKFYWQVFTYMFIHADISHLLCNMLGLLFFGLSLEKAIGSREFLLFYLLCGTLSGLFSFGVYYFTGNYRVMLVGASGAIYAVLFAYAVFYPRSVIFIWGLVPVPAPVMVLLYTIIEIGSQFFGRNSGTAHLTHLFGFAAAWLYVRIRMGIKPMKIWRGI